MTKHKGRSPSADLAIIANATPQVEYLTDISEKDKPWDYHKKLSETVSHHYLQSSDEGFIKYGKRILFCAPILEFGWCVAEDGHLRLRLYHAPFCRVRHCPNCQWRRSMKWKARIYEALPKVEKEHPGYRWLFLTLTVRDPELSQLKDCLKMMRDSWRKMTGYKDYPAVGAIRGLEVTKDANGNPHPHFHALLLVPPSYFGGHNYVKHEKWVAMWRRALKADYDPQVNIQVIKPKKGQSGDDAAIRAAVAEALKYSVKPDELAADPEWLYSMTDALHHVRMVEVYGVLKPLFKDLEEEEGDLVHVGEDGEVTGNQGGEFFNWLPPAGRYGRNKNTLS